MLYFLVGNVLHCISILLQIKLYVIFRFTRWDLNDGYYISMSRAIDSVDETLGFDVKDAGPARVRYEGKSWTSARLLPSGDVGKDELYSTRTLCSTPLRHLPVWTSGTPALIPPSLVLSRRGPAGRSAPSAPPLLLRTTGFVHPPSVTLLHLPRLLCLLFRCPHLPHLPHLSRPLLRCLFVLFPYFVSSSRVYFLRRCLGWCLGVV